MEFIHRANATAVNVVILVSGNVPPLTFESFPGAGNLDLARNRAVPNATTELTPRSNVVPRNAVLLELSIDSPGGRPVFRLCYGGLERKTSIMAPD